MGLVRQVLVMSPAPPPQAQESVMEARSQGRRPSINLSLKSGEEASNVSRGHEFADAAAPRS